MSVGNTESSIASEASTVVVNNQEDAIAETNQGLGFGYTREWSEDQVIVWRRSYRKRVLLESITRLKLAFAGSTYVPSEVANYAKHCIHYAKVDDLNAVMFFYDMLNHYGGFIPLTKRGVAYSVYLRLKNAFDGRLPTDPNFAEDGSEVEGALLWITPRV